MRPDWITDEGYLDVLKLPLGPIVTQALNADPESSRSACSVLASMAGRGGLEAGVVLLGLLAHHRDDATRVAPVIEALGRFASRATVEALAGELYRVPSTNATRGYLNTVLSALTRLPRELWEDRVTAMSSDGRFSPRWRAKFEDALWES